MRFILALSAVVFLLIPHVSAAEWTIHWEAAKGDNEATIPYEPRPLESFLETLPAGHAEANADIKQGLKPEKSTVTELGIHKRRKVVSVELEVPDTVYNRYFLILAEVEPGKFMLCHVHQYNKGSHGHGMPVFRSGDGGFTVAFTSETYGTDGSSRPYLMLCDLKSEPKTRELLPSEGAVSTHAFSPEPNPVLRITQAIAESKSVELTARIYVDDGKRYSYYLQSVEVLGKISRGKEAFTVATAQFIRSSPEGAEMPPARGHGFLLLLDQDYKIASYGRVDGVKDLRLAGNRLTRVADREDAGQVADFSLFDEATRTHGFLMDGNSFIPYPYADKLAPEKGAK